MPAVLPFSGLRFAAPATELEKLVCPPYDVISADEQLQLLKTSPHNAVRLELPLDEPNRPGSRYQAAADCLTSWRQDGVLRSDVRPAYYLSETVYMHAGTELRRRDLLAAVAVEPWSARVALPHEHTMPAPKADRLELLSATHLNASPIWLLARERPAALEDAWADADSRPPSVEFTWRDEHHRLWMVDDPQVMDALQSAFAASEPLYIADGHHRYETSLAFKEEAGRDVPGARGILATITWVDDPGLVALPTHRLLTGLDPALSMEEAETRWGEIFHVEYYPLWEDAPADQIDAFIQQLASSGRVGPSFGVFGLGQPDLFGILALRGRKPPADALPAERSDAWKSLDVSLLHTLLIDPLIAETGRPRTDVLRYTRNPQEAIAEVRAGKADVAFFVNPTPVTGVLAVADAGDLMPEKSTYFYPKAPAGLVMRDLDAPA
ncbi:MAG: DUF1015 domain-containing protein [Chloroflexi bacterium]|nr:DUF1015 domain-containing protein [Chloroflexota bacterium]